MVEDNGEGLERELDLQLAFLDAVAEDQARGGVRPVAAYVARFSSHDPEVIKNLYSEVVPRDTELPERSEAGPDDALKPLRERYDVLDRISFGGQAVVYRARDTVGGDTVAIKVLRGVAQASEQARARLLREARFGQSLTLDGVCGVRDLVEVDGAPALVLDFVEGVTLEAHFEERFRKRRTPPNPDGLIEDLELIAKIADIVQSLHDRGFLHRDLKPGNVMVRPNGDPVLLDLGIATLIRGASTNLTASGERPGTPAYMAPESLDGSGQGVAADVWALGICLYQTITGDRPFDRASVRESEHAIRFEPHDEIRNHAGPIGPDLDLIVGKALRKDPRDRYRSAAAMASDLRRVLAGNKPQAQRPSHLSRTRRWVARNPLLTLMLSVTAVVLASATAVSFVLLDRMRWEKGERERAEARARSMGFKSALSEAEVSGERGEWQAALRACDRADEIIGRRSTESGLLRMQALSAFANWEAIQDEFEALEDIEVPNHLSPALDFRRAVFSYSMDEPGCLSRVEKCRQLSLPDADQLFLDALLEERIGEAEAKAARALLIDPGHEPSHRLYSTFLILWGEPDEIDLHLIRAEDRFPDDAINDLLKAARAFRVGDRELGKELVEAPLMRLESQERNFFSILLRSFGSAWTLFERGALLGKYAIPEAMPLIMGAYAGGAKFMRQMPGMAAPQYRRLLIPRSVAFAIHDFAVVAGTFKKKYAKQSREFLKEFKLVPPAGPEVVAERQRDNCTFAFMKALAHGQKVEMKAFCADIDVAIESASSRRNKRIFRLLAVRTLAETYLFKSAKEGTKDTELAECRHRLRAYVAQLLAGRELEAWHAEALSVFALAAGADDDAHLLMALRARKPGELSEKRRAVEALKERALAGDYGSIPAAAKALKAKGNSFRDLEWLLHLCRARQSREATKSNER